MIGSIFECVFIDPSIGPIKFSQTFNFESAAAWNRRSQWFCACCDASCGACAQPASKCSRYRMALNFLLLTTAILLLHMTSACSLCQPCLSSRFPTQEMGRRLQFPQGSTAVSGCRSPASLPLSNGKLAFPAPASRTMSPQNAGVAAGRQWLDARYLFL